MIHKEHEQNAGTAAANTCTKSRRTRQKRSKTILRALLSTFVPSDTEARAMVVELAEATGLPRRFRASLLGVSEDVLRRWEDGSRKPNQAARRLIVVVCDALKGMSGFEVAHLLAERALRTARDKSRPASERIAALALVPELADFRRRLGNRVMALAAEMDAGEQRAA